jgi:hypothetical protein
MSRDWMEALLGPEAGRQVWYFSGEGFVCDLISLGVAPDRAYGVWRGVWKVESAALAAEFRAEQADYRETAHLQEPERTNERIRRAEKRRRERDW